MAQMQSANLEMRCANISPSKRSFEDIDPIDCRQSSHGVGTYQYQYQYQQHHHHHHHHHHYRQQQLPPPPSPSPLLTSVQLHLQLQQQSRSQSSQQEQRYGHELHNCCQAHYAVTPVHDPISSSTSSAPYSPSKRRSSFSLTRPTHKSMLAERPTIMSTSFPSFMSVYGSEDSGVYRTSVLDAPSKTDENAFPLMTTPSSVPQPPQRHQKPHAHRGSINSLFSESTESSPTTSNSTFDSPIVSDNSASSSPESATSMGPTTSFRLQPQPMILPGDNNGANTRQTPRTLQVPQMPEEANKNVKKLTLDMNMPMLRRPATASGALDAASQPLSAPSSPLKEPMRSARKKPTNLTIRTPGYNQLTFPRVGANVPPTPSHRPSLHHMQSSPALASLASPRGPPAGGMFLPLPSLNTQAGCSSNSSSNSNRNSFMTNSMPDLREENENLVPKSQEAPERGYTEGPVCIYDCGVYLYLEPTAAEASKFDLVINVAKEIRNPFKARGSEEGTVMSVWRGESQQQPMSEPQTALSDFSFKSAWEYPQYTGRTLTPSATTPTQSSFTQRLQQPEYVHVRWDHNSEILEDLFPLCRMIDERIAEGKKVLVHCQLGVSRSASLIIAYGLYKNYQPDFHSMYTAVKSRSRWVGPNMSLIYQLTDFKNKLNRGSVSMKEANPDWFVPSPAGPTTPMASTANVDVTQPHVAKDAQTSSHPTPSENSLQLNKALPPVPPIYGNQLEQHQAHSISEPTMPAPPPPPPPSKSGAPVKRAASKPLPFRERFPHMEIPAHKPRRLGGLAVARPPSAVMDLAMNDVPSTPSIFSPRAAEFTTTPFNIRGAGDLSTPGNRQSKEIPTNFSWLPLRKDGHQRTASKDPRSPHQHSESTEMFRNIDRYL